MGQQIAETGLINSDRRYESVLKSTIVSLRDIEAVPRAARLKRSGNANALKARAAHTQRGFNFFPLNGLFRPS